MNDETKKNEDSQIPAALWSPGMPDQGLAAVPAATTMSPPPPPLPAPPIGVILPRNVQDSTLRYVAPVTGGGFRNDLEENANQYANDLSAPLLAPDGGVTSGGGGAINEVGGEMQPPKYRDVWFAVLFYLQLLGMIVTAAVFGRQIFKDDDDSNPNYNIAHRENGEMVGGFWNHLSTANVIEFCIAFLVLTVFSTMLASSLVLYVLHRYSHQAVQISFAVTPLAFALTALLLTGYTVVAAMTSARRIPPPDRQDSTAAVLELWLAAALVTIVAAIHYWCIRRFVPYTAANLQVALKALQVNRGLFATGCILQVVLVLYLIVAVIALGGVWAYYDNKNDTTNNNSNNNDDNNSSHSMPRVILAAWLLGVFWTQAVTHNILRTATAGAVGAWWFGNTEGETLPAVQRAMTYSFGSICLGSLLLAIIQVLEVLVRWRRQDEEERRRRQRQEGIEANGISMFLCVVQCLLEFILQQLEALLDYLNAWAFVYVGVYGYPFLQAGASVMNVFRQRGVTFILTDHVLYYVLFYVKASIAVLTGGIVVLGSMLFVSLTSTSSGWWNHHDNDSDDAMHVLLQSWWVFGLIGMLVGLWFANIMIFVVEGATRTIIVCFVEHPAASQPTAEYAGKLGTAWAQVYPIQPPVDGFVYTTTTTPNAQSQQQEPFLMNNNAGIGI